jgi:hypothetical protein
MDHAWTTDGRRRAPMDPEWTTDGLRLGAANAIRPVGSTAIFTPPTDSAEHWPKIGRNADGCDPQWPSKGRKLAETAFRSPLSAVGQSRLGFRRQDVHCWPTMRVLTRWALRLSCSVRPTAATAAKGDQRA